MVLFSHYFTHLLSFRFILALFHTFITIWVTGFLKIISVFTNQPQMMFWRLFGLTI